MDDQRAFRVYRTTAEGGAVAVRSFPIIGRGGLLTRAEAETVRASDPGQGWWIGMHGMFRGPGQGEVLRVG
jgi:hypothetical protein